MSAEEHSYDGIDSDDDVPQGSESPDRDTELFIEIRKKFHKNLILLLKAMNKDTVENKNRIKEILKEIKSKGPERVTRRQLIFFVNKLEYTNSNNKGNQEHMYSQLFEVTSRIPKIYDFIGLYVDENAGKLKTKSKKIKAKKSRKSRKLKKKAKKSRKQRRKKKRKSKST